MADHQLTNNDEMPSESPNVDATVTIDESRRPDDVGVNSESRHEVSTAMNNGLVEEIKTLQQRLVSLEKQARPNLTEKALEEQWECARKEMGTEKEKRVWMEEKRRRKEGLMAASPMQPEKQISFDEDFAYNIRLFKLRKEWEQRTAFSMAIDPTQDSSDSDSEYGEEMFAFLQRYLKRTFKRNRHLKVMIRSRELRRMREREEHVDTNDEKESVDNASSEVGKTAEQVADSDARSELIRVPWAKFEVLRDLKEGLSAAIDILIGEPVVEFKNRRYSYQILVQGSRKTKISQVQEKGLVPELDGASGEMPERLRINSRHLLQILSKIHASDEESFCGPSLILLRPFRILAYYNEAIREEFKILADEFEKELLGGDVVTSHPEMCIDPVGTTKEVDNVAEGEPTNSEQSKGQVGEGGGKEVNIAKPPAALEHLKRLVDFMDKDMQNRISHLESGRCQKVFFSDLWYLFQPGNFVIGNDGRQAYRILSMRSVGHRVIDPLRKWFDKSQEEDEDASITIKCVYIDFDGKQLGPVSRVFRISRFEREKAVTSLEIYPLRFHPFQKDSAVSGTNNTGGEFRNYLVKRGRMFLKAAAVRLAAIQPMYYAGPALQTQDEIESQVVVDFEAAFGIEEHINKGWKPQLEKLVGSEDSDDEETKLKKCDADCCTSEKVHDDSYVETKRNEEFIGHLLPKTGEDMPSVAIIPRPLNTKAPEAELTEDDLVIMSYRVFGFVLRNRRWAQLDLTYLNEVQPSANMDKNDRPKTAFDHLVLPSKHKDMILSLVTQHFRDKESSHNDQADIVRGKGKGLILLLHGAPGVGKTTTAEGVAEKFKKPLFQLTCGDLGTTAKEVESALEMNFALASRWGCILLLDEADVFLAQRTKEDFKRNGLVAVFLRVLEYYAGILFLTTNRVGDFDEAFASRIHMSLYYPELGSDETIEVFRLNLELIRNRFQSNSRRIILDEMRIGAFAEKYWKENPFDHWNGRQIRNACQTALALAEYETSDQKADLHLNESHFQVVADAYLAFSKHLKDIYGTHAAQRAKEAGLRAMWVNEKGDLVGNIGPKEAGIFRGDRRSRFQQKSQGHYQVPNPSQFQPQYQPQYQPRYQPQNQPQNQPQFQPQQQNQPQNPVTFSGSQVPTYRGEQGVVIVGGGQGQQGYNDPPLPTQPAQAYHNVDSMSQQHHGPNPNQAMTSFQG